VKRVQVNAIGRFVDEVIADPRPAGVLLTIESLSGGWASMAALREELLRLRKAGKRVVAWLPRGGDEREIFVAMAAETLVAPPSADIGLKGVRSEGIFLRRTLDAIGIDVEVHARKEFKSAADRLTRDSRSDADRVQTEALLDGVENALVAAIAEGRAIDVSRARELVDLGPTRATVAKERGLLDLLGYDDDLANLLGAKIEKAARYFARRRAGRDLRPILFRKPIIAVVQVHGGITAMSSPLARAFGPVADEAQVVADLRAAERDPRVAGVVLDVDSPGGTVTASDAIFAAAKRLASKKPLVARMGDVAASGGYYVAVAARAIVAQPLTITGSIGVVAAQPLVPRLLARMHATRDVIARGKFADLGSPFRSPSEDDRALFEREVDGHYQAFVELVAEARGRSFEDIEPLARGRVWTGADARARGLVDHLGGFPRALELVREALPGIALDPLPRVISAAVPSVRASADESAKKVLAHLLSLALPVRARAFLAPLVVALSDPRARVLALAEMPPSS
jgi:protease-4